MSSDNWWQLAVKHIPDVWLRAGVVQFGSRITAKKQKTKTRNSALQIFVVVVLVLVDWQNRKSSGNSKQGLPESLLICTVQNPSQWFAYDFLPLNIHLFNTFK